MDSKVREEIKDSKRTLKTPFDLEAEKSVIGALLIDKDAIVKVVEFLRPAHFYKTAHINIYEAIVNLYERREPADLVTVPSETPMEECMQIMINRNFRHLLVMEDAKFLGIISMRDMVSTLLKDRDTLIQDLEKYITGSR